MRRAFSLVEVLTALAILALISSGVLVVIDRGAASAANSAQQMKAFEVARENMETLLASTTLKESVEYGESQKYPDIRWQTTVETFYEPITSRMWVRGISSAQYKDPNDEEQTIELEHWLTDVTKDQLLQLAKRQEEGQDAIRRGRARSRRAVAGQWHADAGGWLLCQEQSRSLQTNQRKPQ